MKQSDYKELFQLCNSITEEQALKLNENEYTSNLKYDGTRLLAFILDGDVILYNRRGLIVLFQFPELIEDLKQIKENCILDGEVISLDDNFTKLQSRALTKNTTKIKQLVNDIPIVYKVFDVLKIGDRDVRSNILRDRIEMLKSLFSKYPNLKHTELAEFKPIKELYPIAKDGNREGLIIKDLNAKYNGSRNNNYLKWKFFKEKVIEFTGFELNDNGSITTFNDKGVRCLVSGSETQEVRQTLTQNGKIELICQYLSETENGLYRFISFRGINK